MFDHAVGDEHLSLFVESDPPRICGAVRDNFHSLARRMVPPNATIQNDALHIGSAGASYFRISKNSVAAIKPAVRTPGQPIHHIVLGFERPPVQHGFQRSVRLIITITIRNKNELGRRAKPNSAKSHGNTREIAPFVKEDAARIKSAITVTIFENQNAVFSFPLALPSRIRKAFDHPETSPLVSRHCDRLNNVRFAGKECDAEPIGHGHSARSFLCRNGCFRFGRFRGEGVSGYAE